MPFKNQRQREACYAQAHRDKAAGKKPGWNCAEWESHTPARIPGMKKHASFTAAFMDELAKLAATFATSLQRGVRSGALRSGLTFLKKKVGLGGSK